MAAHANAAVALHVLGRHAEALEHARAAIELDPGATQARITAAVHRRCAQRVRYGARADQRVAGRRTERSRRRAAARLLLAASRTLAEAGAAAERGLALQPNAASLLESLGCAHAVSARFTEACERSSAPWRTAPNVLDLVLRRARCSRSAGSMPPGESSKRPGAGARSRDRVGSAGRDCALRARRSGARRDGSASSSLAQPARRPKRAR